MVRIRWSRVAVVRAALLVGMAAGGCAEPPAGPAPGEHVERPPPHPVLEPVPAPTPAPVPSGPPLTVSGIVRDRTSKSPLEGVKLDAVFLGFQMSTGPGVHVVTDATGTYTISSFPADAVTVRVIVSDTRYAVRLGNWQLKSGDTRIDFEVDRRMTYTLSGVAFEATPNGSAPVEGVVVEAFACELNCAAYMWSRGTTDSNGHYSISDMWAGVETGLWITRAGYVVDGPKPATPCDLCDRLVTSKADTQVDIPLVRQ